MCILSTTKSHAQFASRGGGHHLNELTRRREKIFLPAQYDTVRPVCKKPIKRDSHELLIAGKAYVGDDRNSKARFNIFLIVNIEIIGLSNTRIDFYNGT